MALACAVEPAAFSVPETQPEPPDEVPDELVLLPPAGWLLVVPLPPLEPQALSATALAAISAAIETRRIRPTTVTVLDWCLTADVTCRHGR
jgi:hypothetical protein